MNEARIDARMALAKYESSFAAFGTEAHFTMEDVHVVKEYIDRLEAVVEKAADRIEKLRAALREIVEQERQTAHPVVVHIVKIARKALEGKDDQDHA